MNLSKKNTRCSRKNRQPTTEGSCRPPIFTPHRAFFSVTSYCHTAPSLRVKRGNLFTVRLHLYKRGSNGPVCLLRAV